ncbi:MAG: TonB-dependent receptor [Candidatus Omnitrophota bacterium]
MKVIKFVTLLMFFLTGMGLSAFARDMMIIDDVYVTADEGKGDPTEKNIGREVLKTHKVVDVAEVLSDELIEATMIRKGAYGNEVAIRGFSQSNLRVFADGTILEGACGSRKDPSLSHVSLLTVDKIEVKEGPFDVTRPGILGGCINVITKEPRKGIHGEVLGKAGSFDYWSTGGYLTGGDDTLQALGGYNYSESGQYEDGSGNKLSSFNSSYSQEGRDMKAFKKHDAWGKIKYNLSDKQSLLLSYTFGEGIDIMAPRVGMDMEREITDLAKAEYVVEDLCEFSDRLSISGYFNRVTHEPSDKFRTASINNGFVTANEVQSIITGGKAENTQVTDLGVFKYGMDMYYRNWDGFTKRQDTAVQLNSNLFPDINIFDLGGYLRVDKDIDKWALGAGARCDWFYTEAGREPDGALRFSSAMTDSNARSDVFPSGYFFAKYFLTEEIDIFGGAGHSVRTPTGAERYLQGSADFYGNPDLKPTHNTEGDLGIEINAKKLEFRAKGFYSWLVDYIYQEGPGPKTWTNIDAYIFGGDIRAVYELIYGFSVEGAAACQAGRKYTRPRNNDNDNLAQIPPLKTKAALRYDSSGIIDIEDFSLFGTFEWVRSDKYSDADTDAGEKEISGWNVFNLRGGCKYKIFKLNLGIDNLFDETYAVANSYEYDVTSGSGATPNIVNEPGRFLWASLSVAF